jgi:glycosyltransferase involved in cell wall biosynthesis
MNYAPLVSIILPTFNRAKYIERSIKSILNQTYTNFEFIIIDDGSTDNTDEILSSFNEDRIKIIKGPHKGASAARNSGIQISKGDYLAFQDSDDEWMLNKLEEQLDIFQNIDREVGVVYADMLRIKDTDEEYWSSPDISLGELINPVTLDYQAYGIGIGSAMIKRECFDKQGFFDESLLRFIDLDLFIRLSKYYKFHHIKKPLVRYYATEGISTDLNALCVSRLLLLNKYFDEIRMYDEFIRNQYVIIIRALKEERSQIAAYKSNLKMLESEISFLK